MSFTVTYISNNCHGRRASLLREIRNNIPAWGSCSCSCSSSCVRIYARMLHRGGHRIVYKGQGLHRFLGNRNDDKMSTVGFPSHVCLTAKTTYPSTIRISRALLVHVCLKPYKHSTLQYIQYFTSDTEHMTYCAQEEGREVKTSSCLPVNE